MSWTLDKSRPLGEQIAQELSVKIASGELRAGDRLYSVREVALLAGVNPNTVQKTFEGTQEKGLIYSVRGSGWYVSDRTDVARTAVAERREETTRRYFSDMARLGLSEEETKQLVKEWKHE